ncbi:hypothetical protein V6N13_013981 [Hibiscus sabdariffa]
MISWSEIYNVIEEVVPLYVALALGYGSVKWWGIFTVTHSDNINRLVCYFTLPVFCLEFTSQVDPYRMNYRFIGADMVMKAIVVALLAFWVKFSTNGILVWAITSFSLSNLTNTLVVGVPLIRAMYGQIVVALVIQSFVTQAIVWVALFLLVLEYRKFRTFTIASEGEEEKDVETNSNAGGKTSLLHLMRVVGMKVAINPNVYACCLGIHLKHVCLFNLRFICWR